jgi:hypothetical protein
MQIVRDLLYMLAAPHRRLLVQWRPFRLTRVARYGCDAVAPWGRRVINTL